LLFFPLAPPSDMSFRFCSVLEKLNPSSMVFFGAEGGGGFWPDVARDG